MGQEGPERGRGVASNPEKGGFPTAAKPVSPSLLADVCRLDGAGQDTHAAAQTQRDPQNRTATWHTRRKRWQVTWMRSGKWPVFSLCDSKT